MVPSIARQSVIIKCNLKASVMTGNYELYYAVGLFCKTQGIEIADNLRPQELFDFIKPYVENVSTEDAKIKYLAGLIDGFKVEEPYDSQMEELLHMGLEEENMWESII